VETGVHRWTEIPFHDMTLKCEFKGHSKSLKVVRQRMRLSDAAF